MYRSCYHSYWDTLKSAILGWGEWDETHDANFRLPTGHAACVVETPVSFICVHERGISSCFGNSWRIVRTKVRSHSAEKGSVWPFSKCPLRAVIFTNVMALVRVGNSATDWPRQILDLWSGKGHKLNWDKELKITLTEAEVVKRTLTFFILSLQ